jgi:hypothetical protein
MLISLLSFLFYFLMCTPSALFCSVLFLFFGGIGVWTRASHLLDRPSLPLQQDFSPQHSCYMALTIRMERVKSWYFLVGRESQWMGWWCCSVVESLPTMHKRPWVWSPAQGKETEKSSEMQVRVLSHPKWLRTLYILFYFHHKFMGKIMPKSRASREGHGQKVMGLLGREMKYPLPIWPLVNIASDIWKIV